MTLRLALPALLLLSLLPVPGLAQEDEAGFLENLIEGALGGAGREVTVRGITGALSAEATIELIEIADVDGVWISVRNVTLDWQRAALLRRRLNVEALTVGRLEVLRPPLPAPEGAEAEPEPEDDAEAAGPFALPELPVAVNVSQLSVGALVLGEPLVGQRAEFTLTGNAQLEGGEGAADIALVRVDGQQGGLRLTGGFDNETRILSLDFGLSEAPGGLVVSLAGIPDAPSLSLDIEGEAPIEDYAAQIAFRTGGLDRLVGDVRVAALPAAAEGAAPTPQRRVTADLTGDLADVFLPDYRAFFGRAQSFGLTVDQGAESGVAVERLELAAEGLELSGTAALSPAFLPERAELQGRLGTGLGLPVVLPIPGAPILVAGASVGLDYDAATGDDFDLTLAVDGVQRADGLLVDRITLSADGAATRSGPSVVERVVADIDAEVTGFATPDLALWEAVGDGAALTGRVDWTIGGALQITGLDLSAGDLRLAGEASATGLEAGAPAVTARLDAATGDLDRFSRIAGQTLGGALEAAVAGDFATETGFFDVELTGAVEDLSVGEATADDLFAGRLTIDAAAARDGDGIMVERLLLDGPRLQIDGAGGVDAQNLPRAVRLTGRIGDPDGSPVDLPIPGPETALGAVEIDLTYDPEEDGALTADLLVRDLSREGLGRLGEAELAADGRLLTAGGAVSDADLALDATLSGIALVDAALQDAAGPGATLSAEAVYSAADDAAELSDLALRSGDLALTGAAAVDGVASDAPLAQAALEVATGPLARFAAIAGLPITGGLDAAIAGTFAPATGFFNATIDGAAEDLALGEALADNLLAGTVQIDAAAARDASGVTLERLALDGRNLALEGAASTDGALAPQTVRLTGRVGDPTGTPVVLPIQGPATRIGAVDLDLAYDAAADGRLQADLRAQGLDREGLGRVGDARVRADGQVVLEGTEPRAADLALDAAIADVALADPRLADAAAPGATLAAQARYDAEAGTLDVRDFALRSADLSLTGEASAEGLGTDAALADAQVVFDSGPLQRFATLAGQPLQGRLTLGGAARAAPQTGDFGVDLTAQGRALSSGIPTVDQIVGPSADLILRARRDGGRIDLQRAEIDTAEFDLVASGESTEDGTTITIDGGLRDVGLFTPDFSGPLTVDGDVTNQGDVWAVDVGLAGLGAATAQVAGDVVRPDGTLDVTAVGDVPLAVANRILAPRSISGDASFDLRVTEPSLDGVAGTLAIDGARISDPVLRLALEDITTRVGLEGGAAQIDVGAGLSSGGQLSLTGPVTLSGDFPADLTLALDSLRLVDPRLYDIGLDGEITVAGGLLSDANIAGRIDVGRSELKVPTGLGSAGNVIDVRHVGEPAGSITTRGRAGIVAPGDPGTEEEEEAAGGGPVYGLDVLISAPRQIFTRGRGLDVEMGGEIQIRGTTAQPEPSGSLELIRGRLALIGRQLQFTTATISLQGDLEPDVELVATSSTSDVNASIAIVGPALDPEITFQSEPELPEDEVLAQLFFGKPVQDLTPLEIAQLVAGINRLTGGGGGGPLGFARNTLGVDQLSVQQNADGTTAVTAGRYITERLFTDVTVDSEGESEVQLNFEIRQDFAVRGSFDNEGDTGVGVVFERDY